MAKRTSTTPSVAQTTEGAAASASGATPKRTPTATPKASPATIEVRKEKKRVSIQTLFANMGGKKAEEKKDDPAKTVEAQRSGDEKAPEGKKEEPETEARKDAEAPSGP